MNWNQSNNNLFLQRISFRWILHYGSGFIHVSHTIHLLFLCLQENPFISHTMTAIMYDIHNFRRIQPSIRLFHMWHDLIHRGQSRHSSELSYQYCQKHSISGFVWSKLHLPTLFGYKVMNICVVYFLMYFFVFHSLFFACISVSHLPTLASMDHIMSHIKR